MADKKARKSEKKMSTVNTLYYNKSNSSDKELFDVVNEYVLLIKGIRPKTAIRNFLLRKLPEETGRIRANNGDFLTQPT